MKQFYLKQLFVALFALCCMVANAQTTATVDGIKYKLDATEETATVVANRPTYRGDIVIPETVEHNDTTYNVTAIGDNAFSACINLTSVTIPNSVTTIGDGAFSGCGRLTSITIPNSVYYIGDWAFYSCYSLTAVHISDLSAWCKIRFYSSYSNPLYEANNLYLNGDLVTNLIIPGDVTEIKPYAFHYCTGLTSVTIPNSVTTIGGNAFSYCTDLTSVTIPNSVTIIGENAFLNCTGITNVTIPNSVTIIDDKAFYGCTGLTSITIPNSVTIIDNNAFYGCTGLTSIVVESGNSSYDSREGCNAIIRTNTNTLIVGCKNTVIPNSVTTIGNNAFANCTGLTSITIPNNTITIGDNAFYGCTGLTSMITPGSVTTIGDKAFSDCTGLTSITIGESITAIGDNAFQSCDNIIDIHSYISADYLFQLKDIFSTTVYENATLHIPFGTKEAYSTIAYWNKFKNIVEDESMPMSLAAVYNYVLEYANSILDDTAFGSHGLIKSEAQLSTNAQEETEGPIANLLDSDFMTYFHSTWSAENPSENGFHNLQIDLGEPLDAVALKYSKRTGTGFQKDGSPSKIRVFATNTPDGEWNEVGMQRLGYIHAADTVPLGFKVIVLDNSYRYIRLQVEQTIGNAKSHTYAENLYFNLSEFGAWEARFEEEHIAYKDVPSNLMDILKSALSEAKSELMAGNDNEATAERLYTAFEAVKDYVPTGIEDVYDNNDTHRSNLYYDLQGRIVEHPTRGIYIHNGKKVFIK